MSELPTQPHRGASLDARLHLLDRQMLDDSGDPIGIVDDLELSGVDVDQDIAVDAEAPRVTAIHSGQIVTTRILGGSPPPSRLQEIPWELVASVGIAVSLKPTDAEFDVGWVERWLRDHVIKRIPGGRHAAE